MPRLITLADGKLEGAGFRCRRVGKYNGTERGLTELRAIANSDRLAKYPFYHAAFGKFELRSGRTEVAREQFSTALEFSRNPMEPQLFSQRIEACGR